jgi:hypothetical protein
MNQLAMKLTAYLTLTLLIGCASVDPKSFEQFHKSAAAFQTGADDAYKTAYEMAAKGFATPSPFGIDPTFDQLILTWEEGGDATRPTQEEKPLHAMLRDQRRGSFDLNSAFAEYSQFLALLAAGSEKDAEALEELAKNANANMRSARDALSLEVGDNEVAIVATIGVELLRQKIERDRRDYLRETMGEAQPRIEAFTSFMVITMDLLAGDITQTYLNWAEAKRLDHDAAGRTDRAKRKILVALLDRNDQTLLLLESVRTMRDGYTRIPKAHAEVRRRLDEPEAFLAAVRRLYSDARRLQKLHKELAEAK